MTKIGHMINTGNFESMNAHAAYLINYSLGAFNILETDEKGIGEVTKMSLIYKSRRDTASSTLHQTQSSVQL